jgi:hypothetical protein
MSVNPNKGEVAIPAISVAGFEAGGALLLDFNALCAIEEELGEGIQSLGPKAVSSPTTLRAIFRIGLERRHGTVTDLAAGDIIQSIGMVDAVELVLKAITLSFPEAAKGGDANPPKPGKKPAGTTKTA